MESKKILSDEQISEFLKTLKSRFEKNLKRHAGIEWSKVQLKLEKPSAAGKIQTLHEMEITGGEPDVIQFDNLEGEYFFVDCCSESPIGRRSLCYDAEALNSRKEFKPVNSALAMADEMGIEILTEEQYRVLQKTGNYDTKTSSWVKTPAEIRKLGGAVFCDRRYNHVFLYHNGAESYYAARGFRGLLKV